ncbi:MAG: acyl-CoA dehydrogenase family protein [Candidatus Binataceae bacterium]
MRVQAGNSNMDFGLSEEQQQLKETARGFLARQCPSTSVRKIMATDDGMPRELWSEIAKLGWHALVVPEKFGGAGLTMLDVAMLLEELGFAATPGPFLFSSVLAAKILAEGAGDDLNSKWLPRIADGAAIGTIAIVEDGDSLATSDLATTARKDSAGWLLSGAKWFVPYANVADFIIVAAKTGAGPNDAGLFAVETRAQGVRITELKNLDLTRRVSLVELHGVAVPAPAQLAGGATLLRRLIDLGAVAVAADSLGGCERALQMAVEYSKVREQFGKPIGSFQALKHSAAEIVADLEPARALLWYAAYAQDAFPDAASRAAAMAKARMCDIYSRATGRAVLMHGGIGFTWEHDIHLWFKRARFNDSYFGSPVFHRNRVATLSGY